MDRKRIHNKVNDFCARLNERDNDFSNRGPRDFTKADIALDQEIADFLRCLDETKS